jgi:hypothetical protein
VMPLITDFPPRRQRLFHADHHPEPEPCPRSNTIEPETAYRRGYVAGARAVALALEEAGLLNRGATIPIADFIYRALPQWQRSPSGRHRDAAPRLTLKLMGGWNGNVG